METKKVLLDNLIKEQQEYYRKWFSFDNNLLDSPVIDYESTDEIKSGLEEGRFRISLQGWLFECFYQKCKRPKFLVVIYMGGRPPRFIQKKTYFARWSYYSMIKALGGAILCLDDPMIYRYEKLFLAWYYGDEDKSLIPISLDIIKEVCMYEHINIEDVIFFSASGGGTASIYAAASLPGSLAVAINPQIYIGNYEYAKTFEESTGINLKSRDKLHRDNMSYVMKYGAKESNYCIISNMDSLRDMQDHIIPMCEELDMVPHYGLSVKDNILLWIYSAKGAPNPHIAWETKGLFNAIFYLTRRFHKKGYSTEIEKTALIINDWFSEVWKEKNLNYQMTHKVDNLNKKLLTSYVQKLKDIWPELSIRPIYEIPKYRFCKIPVTQDEGIHYEIGALNDNVTHINVGLHFEHSWRDKRYVIHELIEKAQLDLLEDKFGYKYVINNRNDVGLVAAALKRLIGGTLWMLKEKLPLLEESFLIKEETLCISRK